MANLKYTNGTLFMALEEGASWPHFIRQLRKTTGNVHAMVQAPGESAEDFASRVLEHWNVVVGTSAAPHRFVLGMNEGWDAIAAGARRRLAQTAMNVRRGAGPNEFLIWGGNVRNVEVQGQILALAGALVEGRIKSAGSVRVVFREPSPVVRVAARGAPERSSRCVA